MSVLPSLLFPLFLMGCSSIDAIFNTEPIAQFHPPLPAAVQPVEVDIVVITPDVVRGWLGEMDRGERAPFVYFGLDESDYLTTAQWEAAVRNWAIQILAVLDYYRESPPITGDEEGE
jgi:hypothetical protein